MRVKKNFLIYTDNNARHSAKICFAIVDGGIFKHADEC